MNTILRYRVWDKENETYLYSDGYDTLYEFFRTVENCLDDKYSTPLPHLNDDFIEYERGLAYSADGDVIYENDIVINLADKGNKQEYRIYWDVNTLRVQGITIGIPTPAIIDVDAEIAFNFMIVACWRTRQKDPQNVHPK